MKIKRLALVAAAALMLLFATQGCEPVGDSTLTISNQSSFVLIDIAVAADTDPDYGPNLLRGDVLFPGEELTVVLDCGIYDALVVDEDQLECELFGVDVCFSDAIWIITNADLNSCGF